MSRKGHGQIRQSQVITTYGPGALIDLPRHSAIVGGLDTWPNPGSLDEIVEPRLTRKLGAMTGVPSPMLYAPPPEPNEPWAPREASGHGGSRNGSSCRRPAVATGPIVRGVWCTVRRWTRGDASMASPWCPPASCVPAREDMWMTSTGPGSSTVPKNVAVASYGSTRSAPPAIWPI